jgi:hypothetical protein
VDGRSGKERAATGFCGEEQRPKATNMVDNATYRTTRLIGRVYLISHTPNAAYSWFRALKSHIGDMGRHSVRDEGCDGCLRGREQAQRQTAFFLLGFFAWLAGDTNLFPTQIRQNT